MAANRWLFQFDIDLNTNSSTSYPCYFGACQQLPEGSFQGLGS